MLTLSVRNKSKIKRTQTQKIDELLQSIGLIRHVVPKDGNSLFRCISQCEFLTQNCHINVRQHLLQYANLQTEEFNEISHISVLNYAKKITDTKIDGELLDIRIAAKVYKISFAIYLDEFPTRPLFIETPNSVKTLYLYLSQEGTYDLVFMKESLKNISICQAILYEMLYDHVFKLSNVQFAVKEMLFDRHFACSKITDQASLEKRATCTNMKELLELGITPFPFKVAKALTPKLYRNTEYDIWLNSRKEKFYGKRNNFEFKEGSKCMVVIGNQEYHCYIQHIRGKSEPVEVYVKNLAQKINVEFDQLKLMSVEENVKQSIDSPIEVSQTSSTAIDGNGFFFQWNGQGEIPVKFNDSCFIQNPETYDIMPGQGFPSSYMNQQQPWYMTRNPPTLPNEVIPFKDQIVMFGISDNLNQNCILQPNFIDSYKVVGPQVQSIFPPWYSDHQPDISVCSATIVKK